MPLAKRRDGDPPLEYAQSVGLLLAQDGYNASTPADQVGCQNASFSCCLAGRDHLQTAENGL